MKNIVFNMPKQKKRTEMHPTYWQSIIMFLSSLKPGSHYTNFLFGLQSDFSKISEQQQFPLRPHSYIDTAPELQTEQKVCNFIPLHVLLISE